MNTESEPIRRPILDLVASAPDEERVEFYRVCAFCREGHSGLCVAEIVESISACPATALPGVRAPKWSP
jgi:hypothetical protein